MERTYDIFEVLPDGTRMWKAAVHGHETALARMKKLAVNSPNEFLMMHLPTRHIIALCPSKDPKAPEA